MTDDITIVGYGSAGKPIAQLFIYLGYTVKVYDKKWNMELPETDFYWVSPSIKDHSFLKDKTIMTNECLCMMIDKLFEDGNNYDTDSYYPWIYKNIGSTWNETKKGGNTSWDFRTKIICVTGTLGKTTTTDAIRYLLSRNEKHFLFGGAFTLPASISCDKIHA